MSAQLPHNLPTLQNLLRRDPQSYKEEFNVQYEYLKSKLALFHLSPSTELTAELGELIMFVSHCVKSYPAYHAEFPALLEDLIKKHNNLLPSELRIGICKSLIILRNRNIYSPVSLLKLFFELLSCPDKTLRELLKLHIISDVKSMNMKHKNNKLNRSIQSFIHSVLDKTSPIAAKIATQIMVELYRKRVWNDSKTVNILAEACTSSQNKVMVTALKFFLSNEPNAEEEDSSDEEDEKEKSKKVSNLVRSNTVSKKNRNRVKKLERARLILRKHVKKKRGAEGSFLAIHLIHDPQSFVEQLYKKLNKFNDKWDIKLLLIMLISRIVGVHQLFLLNFYPYLQRYLTHHQTSCTKLLSSLAQACHPLVPPDVIQPLLRHISNAFISENNSNEVMAVGINSVREICIRCPLAMTPELLQDLAQYKKHNDKSVSTSARSLITLFRTLNRSLLAKVDQGKPNEEYNQEGADYAADSAVSAIAGIEHLEDSESGSESDCCEEEEMEEEEEGEAETTGGPCLKRKRCCSEGEQSEKRRKTCSESEPPTLIPKDTPAQRRRTASESERNKPHVSHAMKHAIRKRAISESSNHSAGSRGRTLSESSTGSRKRKHSVSDKKTADQLMTDRILTEEDFAKIEERRLKAAFTGPIRKGKRQADPERMDDNGELVNQDNIEHVAKRKKSTKEERMDAIKEGRSTKKYGIKRAKMNEHASTTNRDKEKKKNFMMTIKKRSVGGKNKKGFAEKQKELKNRLMKRHKG